MVKKYWIMYGFVIVNCHGILYGQMVFWNSVKLFDKNDFACTAYKTLDV